METTLLYKNVFGFRNFISVCQDAWRQVRVGEVQLVAGSLAFSSLLGLVPFLAVVLATFQSIGGLEAFYPKVEHLLYQYMREAVGSDATRVFRSFLKNVHAGKLGTTGAVFLFITSLRMTNDMEVGINRVWNIKNTRPLYARLIYQWAFILLIPVLLAVYIGFNSLEQFKFVHGYIHPKVSNWLVLIGSLFLVFKIVPATMVRKFPALISSVFTALGLYGVHQGFLRLVIKFFNYNKIYGSFAALPLLLIWILTIWYVILMGVALCASLQRRRLA